jgi:serine protease Do
LTNNHVAGEADEIKVTLYDGRHFEAELVGRDPNKDLALIRFETKEDVPVAQLGDSDTLQAGDLVLAVGSPLGFESSVTSGIVSAVGRHSLPGSGIGGFTDYIQTDAAINQGNSGGALVNIFGQVIGLNTWIASPSGGSIGLGFAIPVNNARRAIDDFITKGKSEYGWLGITMGGLSSQAAEDLSLKEASGAFVYGVFKNSPAFKGKILPGDVITGINGIGIEDSSDLLLQVSSLEPGTRAIFDILRYGQPIRIEVKIAVRNDDPMADQGRLWPGFSVAPVNDALRQQFDLDPQAGALIIGSVDEGSPADIAGLKRGDLIRSVNGQEVNSLLEFYQNFNDSKSREILFSINRQDTELIIGLVR